ncbi:hypothetical protein ABUE31_11225 [Mesorhizobium sp. ZMM04-5]|uniref:HPr kinase n=1 Tax=Mesorhizobium marinum TaxID=3228790 RepID=A0ABV3QZR1_9HYPH
MGASEFRRLFRETTFHPVNGGGVVYHRKARRLFALNDAAAFVWLGLRDGKVPAALIVDLRETFGVDGTVAELWVGQAISDFKVIGDVAVSPSPEWPHQDKAEVGARGVDYQLLGQTLRIDAGVSTLKSIDSLLGGMRRQNSGTPDIAVEITDEVDTCQVHFHQNVFGIATRDRIVPEMERFVYEEMVPRVRHFLAFHAALMQCGDIGVLFAAPSGSGKSTLSAVLSSRGWRYRSDEMALLDRELGWRGVPLPPCIKSDNYSRIEKWHPSLRDVSEHIRYGRKVKYLPVQAEGNAADVTIVVFPRLGEAEAAGLTAIDPLAALTQLLSLCVYVPLGFTESDVTRLLLWHERTRYFELAVADPSEAAVALEDLCMNARGW